MSDAREDRRLRSALDELRHVSAREVEVAAVLERASRPRRSAGLRAVSASVVIVLLVLGLMLAVPPTRSALAATLDRLGSFFEGGGAPGSILPPGEDQNVLNWLENASPDSPRVLAQRGTLRLVAFREAGAGHACFSLARSVTECGDLSHWQERFSGGSVLPLATTRTDSPHEVALWGVVTDVVASVELSYRGRPTLATGVSANGFVLVAPEGSVPEELIARDQGGVVVARTDVSDLQWLFCDSIGGCS